MKNICLVIIYNHNFERNIPVLNRIYAGRFSHVFHVMPFYRGSEANVIGVYENSFHFSGYITQAMEKIGAETYSHYLFVADDMVLNPELNEDNVVERLGIGDDAGFIETCKLLTDKDVGEWSTALGGIANIGGTGNACEWRRFMPNEDEAWKRFEEKGFRRQDGVSSLYYRVLKHGLKANPNTPWKLSLYWPYAMAPRMRSLFKSDKKLYPIAWGYSDFAAVPRSAMREFAFYCGVLAAARQFVEMAIPTAMVLACPRMVTAAAAGWKTENGIYDYGVREKLESDAGLSYRKLMEQYPKDYLYVHPVKLSKWKDLP